MVPDFIKIKLWTGGGLGKVHGVLQTTFSFDDSVEDSQNSEKNGHIPNYSLLQQKNTD